MKQVLLLSVAIMLLSISCKKDNPSDKTSNLFVKVVSYNGSSVEGATIITVPETETIVSDTYGMATIENIPVGTYDVYAIYSNYGSGKKSVQVVENSGIDVEISIEYGNFPNFIPQIFVTEPEQQGGAYIFGSPDSVSFLINVKNGTPGNQVIWESDLDGEIGTSVINDDLSSSIDFDGLTDGEHVFSLTAKGNAGIDGFLDFVVKTDGPSSVFLYPLEVESFNLKLTWSYYTGDNFSSYSVMQRKEISNGGYSESSVKFIYGEWDTITTIPIQNEDDCKYYIKVITDNYYTASSSNMRFFEKNYFGESFNSSCRDMVLHKFKNHVYLMYNSEVILYDYENREIIASRAISSMKQHYDIRYDGEKAVLYFASDIRVYIIDGEDLTLKRAINFPNTVKSVSAISNDIIFASVYEDYSSSVIYSYSLSQSAIIDSIGNDESIDYYLNRVPLNNKIIVVYDTYNYEMKYLNYNTNGEINGFDNTTASGGYYYNDYPFSFSPNSEYFIPIRDDSKVYRTDDNISQVGILSNNYDYKDITYSTGGDTIFALTSSNSWFMTYSYPGLELIDEIETENYISFVQKKGNDFYCLMRLSSSYYNNYYFMKYEPR